MSRHNVGRAERTLAGLALLLVVTLLDFPWFDFSYTPVVRPHASPGLARPIYPATTASATQAPDGLLGVLAAAAALLLLADLAVEWLWPEIRPPRIKQNRGTMRVLLAALVIAFLGLKFVSHIDFRGYQSFAWGFYVDAAVAAALLLVALRARRVTSPPAPSDNPGIDGFQPSKTPPR